MTAGILGVLRAGDDDGDDARKRAGRPAQAPIWLRASTEVLPPVRRLGLSTAARSAGCQLRRPAVGFLRPAPRPPSPGVYLRLPDRRGLATAIARGNVVIGFRRTLPARRLAQLRALHDEAPGAALLGEGAERRDQVTAAAGRRVLGCPQFSDGLFDAVRAFRTRYARP